MDPGDEPLAAVVLLRCDGEEHLLGPVYGPRTCDLGFVEDLARVQLAALRFGWSIRLVDVRPDVLELVDLVGLRSALMG